MRALSPFLLLDYHAPFVYPPTPFVRGLAQHPHRGIETVTVVFEGTLAHHDRMGTRGIIEPGDVQWMAAGSGILHQEYHEATFARAGGVLHMLQVWVNVPAAHKMKPPTYQGLEARAIPSVSLAHDGGSVRVIAGAFDGVVGAARTVTPVGMLDVHLEVGATLALDFDAGHNVAILVIVGSICIDADRFAKSGDFVIFGRGGRTIAIGARSAATHVLVLSGAPIDEPLVRDGPFVMNTDREIREAYADLKAARFGRP